MKCKIDKAALLRIASVAATVADRKSSMPILGMVRLETVESAEGSRLRGDATDLYSRVRVTQSCETESPGEVCVNAAALKSLVANLPDGTVTVSTDGDRRVTVRTGSFRRTLPSLPSDDFPPMPKAEEVTQSVEVSGAELGAVLSQVRPAMSTDESRPHLACVLLEGSNGVAVTTDGHRLHKAEGVAWGIDLQVPPKGVGLLASLTSAETVTLSTSGGLMHAEAGDTRLSVKLVDEVFPPYSKVIPGKRKEATVQVEAAKILGACKRLGLVGDALRVTSLAGFLRLSASAPGDEAEEEMSAECSVVGKTVGLSARYLADAVSACGAETVEIAIADELDPVVVRADGFVGVIMPMRI